MATLGPTGSPGASANPGGGYIFASPLYTMPEAGSITQVSVFLYDEGSVDGQFVVRLYDSSGNTLATSATGGSGGAGSFVNAAITYSASNGQQIRIAVQYNGGEVYQGVDDGTTGQGYSAGDGHTFGVWPSDSVSFSQDFDWQLGAYLTYTPAGAATGRSRIIGGKLVGGILVRAG